MPVKKLTQKQLERGGFNTPLNSIMTHPDLSLDSRMVYAIATSKPETWIFHLSDLTQDVFHSKSQNRLKNAIEELRKLGLVTGSFQDKNLTFYHSPLKKLSGEDS